METIQVEGFQTCYQMYRNLTDKATWTSESEDIFESKQHQSNRDNIFGHHFRDMFIIFTYLHFLDFNIRKLHISPFPFFLTQTEVTNLDSYWDYVHCTKEVNLSDAELPA